MSRLKRKNKKQGGMTTTCHNHISQTNEWHLEKEILEHSRVQLKERDQLSLPRRDGCKTRKDIADSLILLSLWCPLCVCGFWGCCCVAKENKIVAKRSEFIVTYILFNSQEYSFFDLVWCFTPLSTAMVMLGGSVHIITLFVPGKAWLSG